MTSENKLLLALGFSFFLLVQANAFAIDPVDHQHIIDEGSMSYTPVTTDIMWERIHAAAIDYKQYGQIPRSGFYDIAYPADQQEYEKMGGYGVMLITVLSHNKEELPPKRVYVKGEKGVVELRELARKSSTISAINEEVVQSFGTNRADILFLFPMQLRAQLGELTIDYAKNRDGFVLGRFPLDEDELPVKAPTMKAPPQKALEELVKRELPMFAEEVKNKGPKSK